MSSGPKRRGCDVCRKRHVKCDRQQPSCSQCIKAGWTCPGYISHFSFVNYSQKYPVGRARDSPDEGTSANRRPNQQPLRPKSTSPMSLSPNALTPLTRIQPKPSSPALAPSAPGLLREKFSQTLAGPNIAAGFEVMTTDAYLRVFVDLIGKYQATDRAIELIVVASALPLEERNVSTSSSQALLYAHHMAIKSLRDAIDDPSLVKSTGTLAAAMMLQMFEQHINGIDSQARAFHSTGLTKLVQFRGPESFEDDCDSAILEARTSTIFFSAMREGEECFLAEPEWRDLYVRMAANHVPRPGRMSPEQLEMMNACCSMPGAVAAFREWLQIEEAVASTGHRRQSFSPPALTGYTSEQISLEEYLVLHRRRVRQWWRRNLPVPADYTSGPWNESEKMIMTVGMALQIVAVNYMLATVAPDAVSRDEPIECVGENYDECVASLGPRPFDLCNNLLEESKQLALITRKHIEAQPDHSFFAHSAQGLSSRFLWERQRDHSFVTISETSRRIGECYDWAYSAGSR